MHQVRSLHPDDGTVHHGIPVTTVARTLLDLAETVSPPSFNALSRKPIA